MTNQEAIQILKAEYQKHRKDFYPDTRQAFEMAINALYEKSTDKFHKDIPLSEKSC